MSPTCEIHRMLYSTLVCPMCARGLSVLPATGLAPSPGGGQQEVARVLAAAQGVCDNAKAYANRTLYFVEASAMDELIFEVRETAAVVETLRITVVRGCVSLVNDAHWKHLPEWWRGTIWGMLNQAGGADISAAPEPDEGGETCE